MSSGSVRITTINGTGESPTPFTITYATPTVSAFTPASGPATQEVIITGQNFLGATSVRFGSTEAARFKVVDASTLQAWTATGNVTGTISVTTPGGAGASSSAFTALYTVAGHGLYDWIPTVLYSSSVGYARDYAAKVRRPIRYAEIRYLDATTGTTLFTKITDANGNFRFDVPYGVSGKIRVYAKSLTNGWNARVVDNTRNQALYAVGASTIYSSDATAIQFVAPTNYANGAYTTRAGAPFAILDKTLDELLTLKGAAATFSLPVLNLNWSPLNTSSTEYSPSTGLILTSHYSQESGVSNLYLLGDEETDTDEFDDHVIAHEVMHYIDDRYYRSDSKGGSHALGDRLDPKVAFSEGFANAAAGIVLRDPVFVDTYANASYFFDVSAAPRDRGLHSEESVQNFVWSLFENRDPTPKSGSFERINAIKRDYVRLSTATTNVQTFASYYNQVYGGSAESLSSLWMNSVGLPYSSLCLGTCLGSGDKADPFDRDNDIGTFMDKSYYLGISRSPEFWRLTRSLAAGVNRSTDHEKITSEFFNRFAASRTYRFVGNGLTTTISVEALKSSGTCDQDILDMSVTSVASGKTSTIISDLTEIGPTAGCPSVTFTAVKGKSYNIEIQGWGTQIDGFDLRVSEAP